MVGGVGSEQKADSLNRQGVETVFREPVKEKSGAVFGQVDYAFTPELKGVLSVRWDDSDQRQGQLSPRGALVYAPNPRHTLRLTYGEAFLRPTLAVAFLGGSHRAGVGSCRPGGGLRAATRRGTVGVRWHRVVGPGQ